MTDGGGGGDDDADDNDTQLLMCGRERYFKLGSGPHNTKGLTPLVYSTAVTIHAT